MALSKGIWPLVRGKMGRGWDRSIENRKKSHEIKLTNVDFM
jgi:hypothetical protein